MEEVMSLINDWNEDCTLLERRRIQDGEGGWLTSWEDGASFTAAITFDSSTQAKIAEAQGVTSLYSVYTTKNALLSYHDVFRRNSDGQVFRVTSNGQDVQTPASASFEFSKVSAERWELTQ
jgi:hypothetical protein